MKAFCPGHITGIFAIEDTHRLPEKKGSVGMGFCIELGASAEVKSGQGSGISITMNGQESEASVTRSAIDVLVPGLSNSIEVSIGHDVPMGQGFGMSAAGTFAACLALAVELGIPDPKYAALKATHVSEVKHGTGLGDAVAQSVGGFVRRMEPGIPPHGEFERLDFQADEVVLCVTGEPTSTTKILASPEKRLRIRDSGHACLRDFEAGLDLASFINASWAFARDSGLATRDMVRIFKEIRKIGQGSMVMLGNSIFAFGDIDSLEENLKEHGRTFRCSINRTGPFIVD